MVDTTKSSHMEVEGRAIIIGSRSQFLQGLLEMTENVCKKIRIDNRIIRQFVWHRYFVIFCVYLFLFIGFKASDIIKLLTIILMQHLTKLFQLFLCDIYLNYFWKKVLIRIEIYSYRWLNRPIGPITFRAILMFKLTLKKLD